MSKPSWLEEDRLRRIEALLERIAVALETSRIAGIVASTAVCGLCGSGGGQHDDGCANER